LFIPFVLASLLWKNRTDRIYRDREREIYSNIFGEQLNDIKEKSQERAQVNKIRNEKDEVINYTLQ